MNALWEARIRRATELSSVYPFAAEAMRFYARIATFQQSLSAAFEDEGTNSLSGSSNDSLRGELDIFALLPKFSGFLMTIQQTAPPPLAQAAASLARRGLAAWQSVIEDFWQRESSLEVGVSSDSAPHATGTMSERWLAWLFLQPYAEYLAVRRAPRPVDGNQSNCPLCGAKPIVGVLRPEGDGARKSLICMLCAHEWMFRRLCCPVCGEHREPQMAFYSAPEIPHVRVDVCDTCHTYLKTVDLTKTGLAVPIVDELATSPLDLWARENGYTKLQINMLGV